MAKKPKQKELKPNVNPNDEADCFTRYDEGMAEIARVKQSLGTMLKNYEKMGVDTDAVKYAYRMSHKDEAQQIHRSRTATLARLGIIEVEWEAGGQANFLKGVTIEKPTGEAATKLILGRARADGYNSGLSGGLIGACKYGAGSEEFVVWRDGWQLGHSDRLEKNPEADKVTKSEPRKRGKKQNGTSAASPPSEDSIGTHAGTA